MSLLKYPFFKPKRRVGDSSSETVNDNGLEHGRKGWAFFNKITSFFSGRVQETINEDVESLRRLEAIETKDSGVSFKQESITVDSEQLIGEGSLEPSLDEGSSEPSLDEVKQSLDDDDTLDLVSTGSPESVLLDEETIVDEPNDFATIS